MTAKRSLGIGMLAALAGGFSRALAAEGHAADPNPPAPTAKIMVSLTVLCAVRIFAAEVAVGDAELAVVLGANPSPAEIGRAHV